MSGQVIRSTNFVADSASLIQELAQSCIRERGEFRIGLSGGNTPRPVYSEWARVGRTNPWHQVRISFGDERCVPPDDQQSNYRMARDCLFGPANVPAESIMRMRGEIEPETAAQEYEDELARLARHRGEQLYQHDLILLGVGDDGHTASLFPGTAALAQNDRAVVANFVPKLNAWRLTMTYSLINDARCVCFLINAKKNPELIDRVIDGDTQYPAARVRPAAGELIWMLGETA